MEAIVLILMCLVVFMTWLKLSFLKVWQMAVVAVCCALFTALSWPWAIQQSRNEIAEWLANQPLMLDTAVVLTLEVLWQMAYCLLAGWMLYGERVSRRTLCAYRTLRFFPGILILPVLFYMLVQVIYALTGHDFAWIGWGMGAVVLVALPLGGVALRALLPEKDLRLEVLFLAAALVLLLGILATVNGTTQFKGSDPVEWSALAAFCALTLIAAILGFLRRSYKMKQL